MQYLVTFRDGSQGIFTWEVLQFMLMEEPENIASYELYEPEPEPPPTDEELLYANWLRTGGTGSMTYWQSLGSPLFYTPPPVMPEYKGTMIKKELEYDGSRKAIPIY